MRFPSDWPRSFMVLVLTAIVNLFTKSIATVAGVSFAAAVLPDLHRFRARQPQQTRARRAAHEGTLPAAAERHGGALRDWESVPGNVMVTVRDYNTLNHLKWALERIDTKEQDIVVMSARVSQFGSAAYDLSTEQIFSDYEQQLFTRACQRCGKLRQARFAAGGAGPRPLVGHCADREQSRSFRGGLGTLEQDDVPANRPSNSASLGGDARAQAAVHFPGGVSRSARWTLSTSVRIRRR